MKTYNDKDYETDDFARIFEKIFFFVVCPPLLLALPYFIYNEYQNGNKKDANVLLTITLLIIGFFAFGLIIS